MFENHSRQNSAASVGRDSRLSHTGTNNSVYSNLSEHSNLSISQGTNRFYLYDLYEQDLTIFLLYQSIQKMYS